MPETKIKPRRGILLYFLQVNTTNTSRHWISYKACGSASYDLENEIIAIADEFDMAFTGKLYIPILLNQSIAKDVTTTWISIFHGITKEIVATERDLL